MLARIDSALAGQSAPRAGEDVRLVAYRPSDAAVRKACDLLDKIKGAYGHWGGWSATPSACDEAINLLRYSDATTPQPAAQAAPAVPLLAKEHQGMRVDYSSLLQQAANALVLGGKATGLAEMLRQLQGHMTELGLRWYASDTAVVDDFCQLYCIGRDARAALATQGASHDD